MKGSPKNAEQICWQHLGSELVFTQDIEGKYTSFYWQDAEKYGLNEERVIGKSMAETIGPVTKIAYAEKIRRVVENRVPEKYYCVFQYAGQSFPFELAIAPILLEDGTVKTILAIGHLLTEAERKIYSGVVLTNHANPYQKLLSQITRKISRTLDLETIRLQTVDSVGEALQISRCLLFSYNSPKEQLRVESEYRHQEWISMLGYQFEVESEAYYKQALALREPVAVDRLITDEFGYKSVLLVSTCYQNQPNGLICLHQCDFYRNWSLAEIELMQEIAERVGTAIAHATVYQELKEARIQAEELSNLKSDFLASTTHELRTPLNGIIGFLKLIIDGMADDPEEQREFVEQAYQSAIHLLNLIDDILDIAKIEAGKMKLDLGSVDLNELFHNVENFTRSQAQQKKLNLIIRVPATYDNIAIYGNYQRLLQVMLNLVGNAIKFTREGGVTISAEVVPKKVNRHNQEFLGMLKISVADTGIGVPLDKQEKLFQNFFQIDSGRSREYGGTGLGLAISQKLVEAMGGKISFYSMGEGLGSTVTFTVPLTHLPVIKTSSPEEI